MKSSGCFLQFFSALWGLLFGCQNRRMFTLIQWLDIIAGSSPKPVFIGRWEKKRMARAREGYRANNMDVKVLSIFSRTRYGKQVYTIDNYTVSICIGVTRSRSEMQRIDPISNESRHRHCVHKACRQLVGGLST